MRNKKLRKASGGLSFNGNASINGSAHMLDNSRKTKIDNSELTESKISKKFKFDLDATIPV